MKRLDKFLLGIIIPLGVFFVMRGFFAFLSDIRDEEEVCKFNDGDTVVHIITEEEWHVVKSLEYCRMVIVNKDKKFHQYEEEYMYKHKNSQ